VARMLELEVYAEGVRDLSKVMELDIELEAIPDLHYKVDRNHDIVYMELGWTHRDLSRDPGRFSQARPRAQIRRRRSARVTSENQDSAAELVKVRDVNGEC
jgi:hypothetical protein